MKPNFLYLFCGMVFTFYFCLLLQESPFAEGMRQKLGKGFASVRVLAAILGFAFLTVFSVQMVRAGWL